MEGLVQDLHYAFRTLRKNAAFTLVAVAALVVGIGVNTTVFTAYNAIALRPLPVKDPGTLVRFYRWLQAGRNPLFSYSEYSDIRQHNRTLSDLIAERRCAVRLSSANNGNNGHRSGHPEKALGQLVSGNYFSALGARAALGRTFLPEEDQAPGANPVLVLSYPFWQRWFGGDPCVLGTRLTLSGTSFTIVGIAPRDFIGTGSPPLVPDMWSPLAMQAEFDPRDDWLRSRRERAIEILGRLRPGVSRQQAQAEMLTLIAQGERALSKEDRTLSLQLIPATLFEETDTIEFQGTAAIVMAAVGLVLLIACANVANMLLAKSIARRKEIGIRLALGASRARIVRQLLTESVLLGLLSGAFGLLLSAWTCHLLWLFVQQWLQKTSSLLATLSVNMQPDMRVFGYALVASVLTGIAFGLAPSLQMSKPDLIRALKGEASGLQGLRQLNGLFRISLRDTMIGAQVATCVILLIAAGLLARGLLRARATEPGFDTSKLFALTVDSAPLGYDRGQTAQLERSLVKLLEALPEVQSVGLAAYPLMNHGNTSFAIEGGGARAGALPSKAYYNIVSPDYFRVLGIGIVRGRNFSEQEALERTHLVIVSEATAQRFWAGENAIGKRIRITCESCRDLPSSDAEVIGVARAVRSVSLSKVDPTYLYFPGTSNSPVNMTLFVKTRIETLKAMELVYRKIEAMNRTLPSHLPMRSVDEGLFVERLFSQISAGIAATMGLLALLLASVGIFGVMAFVVSQRTREIGIRMAFGADKGDVLRLVLRQGMAPVGVGVVVGLVGSISVSRLLVALVTTPGSMDLLFGVSPTDPLAYTAVSLFLATVAMLAAALPAWRATLVSPMSVLRHE